VRLELAVQEALRSKARARYRRKIGVAAGVMATLGIAAAVTLALRAPTSRGADGAPLAKREPAPMLLDDGALSVEHVGGSTPLLRGALHASAAGETLRSGPRTTLRMSDGASVELRDAVVRVESFGKSAAFVLDAGAIGVDARSDAVRFVVRTADATTRGQSARFAVARAGSDCGRTRIVVERGVVEVETPRGTETVAPGAVWSDCDREPTRTAGSAPSSDGSLGDQNDALASAVAARRAGRTDDALRAYAQFLKRWPSGPLSEVARADRMNLLATRDSSAAARAAREYLQHHPKGPAADRARELAKKGSE
jgi:hypothetical protein